MPCNPLEYFNKNIVQFDIQIKHYKKRSFWIAFYRTAVFLTGLILAIYFINKKEITGLWITLMTALPGFIALFLIHQRISRKLRFSEILKSINISEIRKKYYDHAGLEEGNIFFDEDHPYLKDLDIFGPNSIFQYLNRAATFQGQKILAGWLKSKASKREIQLRQVAVQELSDNPEWIQHFEAEGKIYPSEENKDESTLKFLSDKNKSLLNRKIVIVWILLIIGLITVTTLYGLEKVGLNIWVISPVLNLLFLAYIRPKIKDAYRSTRGAAGAFKNHYNRIKLIEIHKVEAEKLNELKEVLFTGVTPASLALKILSRILSSLDNMGNMMYQILNIFVILDMAILISVDKWRRRYSSHLSGWLAAIYETEALISLAGFYFANPDFIFPEISNEKLTLQGLQIGHPLIRADKRISNDFSFNGKGSVAIITGSNMAGKSTFLRTIGINTVLGLCGAPVCTKSMTIPDIQVFTSMRTQDNLEKNMSSFYAELERIRQLIKLTSRESVLFLLDEILKGTNSQDRHTGAISLIRQLNLTTSFGLISTHDVELAYQMKNDTHIRNYSFDSQIEGDQILFDFKLKEGICQNFNASQLMKKMGINMITDG